MYTYCTDRKKTPAGSGHNRAGGRLTKKRFGRYPRLRDQLCQNLIAGASRKSNTKSYISLFFKSQDGLYISTPHLFSALFSSTLSLP